MRKPENAPNVIQRTFTLHPMHMEMIDNLLQNKGCISYSDVIRRAVEFYHEKSFPDYIYKLTPAAEQKKKKMDMEKKFEDMSDEQFVAQGIPGALVRSNAAGKQFVLIHQIANFVLAVPLEGIKKWAEDNPADIDFHLEKTKDKTVEEALSEYIKGVLTQQYGIIFG